MPNIVTLSQDSKFCSVNSSAYETVCVFTWSHRNGALIGPAKYPGNGVCVILKGLELATHSVLFCCFPFNLLDKLHDLWDFISVLHCSISVKINACIPAVVSKPKNII
jgi:hypothetical protein